MRSRAPAANDIYIYIDTALNGILNNGGMLKCICDRGLTTGPRIFLRRPISPMVCHGRGNGGGGEKGSESSKRGSGEGGGRRV